MLRRTVATRAGQVVKSWADPTEDDLRAEIYKIFSEKEPGNPIACSLGVLGAGMLGDLELYNWGKKILAEDLGVPGLGLLNHNEATNDELWKAVNDACEQFDNHLGPRDVRLWMLGRLAMGAGFMCDEATASTAAGVLYKKLKYATSMAFPEVWAAGYHLQHRGRTTAGSDKQFQSSPGGVHKAKDAFGVELKRLHTMVRALPITADPGSVMWSRVMLVHGACASTAREHWGRLQWCLDLTHLPVSDYKAWAYAMLSHAAASSGHATDSSELAQKAMHILRTVPASQLAPHEAMLTTLQLRTAFIDLHRSEPKLSKKTAKKCIPNLPFVVKGKPPKMLGVPRYGTFRLRDYQPIFIGDGVVSGI
eukprot:TRINITY_DN5710_c6_g1_i1.p1 TRINITY_DN5710_c6_g1~~TRINITY_DN5710_c6_g1_i1.p1  ORF type:complete len:364 (+),score=67.26 TRINITY_DN5710_c6_g1_i1:57-1148(+)